MSFWTGFTTGLASSVDRSLQNAMEKRDREISAAKSFWQQRQAAKMEAEDIAEKEYNAKAKEAFDFFSTELGDPTLAAAAMKKIGTPDDALALKKSIQATLDAGDTIDIPAMFKNFKAGTAKLDKAGAFAQVSYQRTDTGLPTGFSGATLGVDDPLGRLFGKEGQAAERAAASLQEQTEATMTAPREAADIGTVGSIDRSQLRTAKLEQERREDRTRNIRAEELGIEKMTVNIDAIKLGMLRTEQAIKLEKEAAELAKDKFASAEQQREIENKRAEAEALRRQTELIMKSEKHVVDMEAAGLSIEEQKREAEKAKRFPEFASFEKAIVYAKTQLARSDLSDQERTDLEKLSTDMTNAAIAYNEEVTNAGGSAIEFSKQSLDSIVQGARKLELENVPTRSVGDEIEYVIEGNEAEYFAGMERVLNTVTRRLTGPSRTVTENGQTRTVPGTMPPEASRYIDALRKNNSEKVYAYGDRIAKSHQDITQQLAEATSPRDKNNLQAQLDAMKYVSENDFNTGVQANISAGLSELKAAIKYAQDNNFRAGTVIPQGDSYAVWTGSRFVQGNM